MGNTTTGARRTRILRPLALPLAVLLVAGLMPALAVGARDGLEPRAAGEPWATLVRTVGFRSASAAHLGEFAAIGNFNENIDPGVDDAWDGAGTVTVRDNVNAVSAEFGLFVEDGRRFRLLGANGLWVRFGGNPLTARAAGSEWDSGWTFRVRRPRVWELPEATLTELRRNHVSPRSAVCVEVFDTGGAARGWMTWGAGVQDPDRGPGFQVYPVGVAGGKCGADTSTLFLTEVLPKGTPVRDLTSPAADFEIDPVNRARFVSQDMRGPRDGAGDFRSVADDAALTAALTQIHGYFNDTLFGIDYLNEELSDEVHSFIADQAFNTLAGLNVEIVLPSDGDGLSVDPVGVAVAVLAGAANLLPAGGGFFSTVISASYTVATVGPTLFQDAEDPTPIEVDLSALRETLNTRQEIAAKYDEYFAAIDKNINSLYDSLRLDCTDAAHCRDDRRIAAWIDLYPSLPAFSATERDRAFETLLLGYEREIYRAFIAARGVLRPVHQEQAACADGDGNDAPAGNSEFLGYFRGYAQHAVEGVATDLVATTVWRPFHDECVCDIDYGTPEVPVWTYYYCDVSVFTTWSLGWKNAGSTPPSEAAAVILQDLFTPVNARYPDEGGLGLSRREVACQWITHDPADGYDPCEFPFYDLASATPGQAGFIANPEDMTGMPWIEALWVADQIELDDGDTLADDRPGTDPDVFSSYVPRLEYGSCDAVPLPRSAAGGKSAWVYVANLTDAAIDVYLRLASGGEELVAEAEAIPPQAAFPPVGQLYADAVLLPGARVGDVYRVVRAGTGECLGTWTVLPRPAGAVVPYSVAEVHGQNGILLDWSW